MKVLCNCGKPVKYSHRTENGYEVMSCNKYVICPTYDELHNELNILKSKLKLIEQVAVDLSLYREGTQQYATAYSKLEQYINEGV